MASHIVCAMFETRALIPRSAFSLRDAPRAGDVWRSFQEIAVDASTDAGWPPKRYRDESAAFIVRSMTVRHAQEPYYGEALTGTTWVSRMRRELFSTREVRIVSKERGAIASARQEWVHVSAAMVPTRAPKSLLDAFEPETAPGDFLEPTLPEITEKFAASATLEFEFDAWWTWMDPLDHANHPAYIDWCDEALSRSLAAKGMNPLALLPAAEEVTFRFGVRGGQRVSVRSHALGFDSKGNLAVAHRIFALLPEGETLAANATTFRRLHGEQERTQLAALFTP